MSAASMSPGEKRAAVSLLFLFCLVQTPVCVTAGKILIWPAEFSHWLNIKIIIDELIMRGHEVTVVTHTATPSVKTEQSSGYNVEVVHVSFTKQDVIKNLNHFIDFWIYELQNSTIYQSYQKMNEIIDLMTEQNQELCRELFKREDLLERWRKEKYDVVLIDPMQMCGDILAEKLNLPLVISLRFTFGSVLERRCAQLPTPPSYVPAIGLGYTEHMDFIMRVKNVLFNVLQDFLFSLLAVMKWDPLYTEIIGKSRLE